MAIDNIARGLAQKANEAIANLDVLKRLSRLEKVVYGKQEEQE